MSGQYRWARQPPWREKTWRCPVCAINCIRVIVPKGHGPRIVLRCDACRVRWRIGLRAKRFPMQWKYDGCRPVGWRRSLRTLVRK